MWDACAEDTGLEANADKTQIWGRDGAAEKELKAAGFEVIPVGVVLGEVFGQARRVQASHEKKRQREVQATAV
eukprot:15485669-Alexandrium_andersonii.AAC.1